MFVCCLYSFTKLMRTTGKRLVKNRYNSCLSRVIVMVTIVEVVFTNFNDLILYSLTYSNPRNSAVPGNKLMWRPPPIALLIISIEHSCVSNGYNSNRKEQANFSVSLFLTRSVLQKTSPMNGTLFTFIKVRQTLRFHKTTWSFVSSLD